MKDIELETSARLNLQLQDLNSPRAVFNHASSKIVCVVRVAFSPFKPFVRFTEVAVSGFARLFCVSRHSNGVVVEPLGDMAHNNVYPPGEGDIEVIWKEVAAVLLKGFILLAILGDDLAVGWVESFAEAAYNSQF